DGLGPGLQVRAGSMSELTARPLLTGAAVVVIAVAGALLFAQAGMRAPSADIQALALLLTASGAGSLIVGSAAAGWIGGRLPSLRLRLLLAYGLGIVVVLVVVAATSVLMFLNTHDLLLLLLLLTFSSVVSLTFGYIAASTL